MGGVCVAAEVWCVVAKGDVGQWAVPRGGQCLEAAPRNVKLRGGRRSWKGLRKRNGEREGWAAVEQISIRRVDVAALGELSMRPSRPFFAAMWRAIQPICGEGSERRAAEW
jgi:hypothetical protein